MIEYVLIIWLGTMDNFAVYSSFKTMKECEDKRQQVTKALTQADSEMRVSCRVRYTSKENK